MGNQNDKSISIVDSKQKGCCENFSLFISNGNTDSSDFTCPICFRIFLSPRIMKCKHTFCEQCVQQWSKCNSMICPMCRLESKRSRGSFGRVHKRLQNRITKLFLKCRNCSWTGSYCQFITQFSIQPYLDDQEVKCEKVEQEKVGQIFQVMQQKKQAMQQKNYVMQQKKQVVEEKNYVMEQMEKVEKQEVEREQDEVVQVKMKKKREEYEIYFGPLHNLSQDTSFNYPILPDDGLGVPSNNDIKPTE